MPNYRRWYVSGGTVFFTVVTYHRQPLFAADDAARLLGRVLRRVRDELPFVTVACVLLPDHFHTIWTLPSGDSDFSTRWKRIKRDFTVDWLDAGNKEYPVTAAQHHRGSRGIWQRRFYEHQVRDEDELHTLCDYIHYNPVKHGRASRPSEWQWSTFHRFVAAGHYPSEWGRSEPDTIRNIELD
jgi:putative transposase